MDVVDINKTVRGYSEQLCGNTLQNQMTGKFLDKLMLRN